MIYELTKSYQEPHRFYHTLHHILYMLDLCKKLGWELTEPLCYAIWFHDETYQPGKNDNEEISAVMLMDHFFDRYSSEIWDHGTRGGRDYFDKDDVCKAYPELKDIRQAILDTKDHIPRCELSKRLIDLDLAILAEESVFMDLGSELENTFPDFMTCYYQMGEWDYMTYLLQVRREFSAATDRQWAEGRSAWIKGMLERKQIFYTPEFSGEKEKQARANLEGELKTYERYLHG